ncbi:DNA sulfur modification protein DndD [Pseudidiomarina sp.]|uniref:DNA sulfur modification protein DndD n=1 Tax=Pseudidiomarina sp. TaxID=2081707 RepID=UPI003A97A23E
MIFKTLSLENFRVFNGEHVIDLAPRKDGLFTKPIVLFGGLNGAGKTSILTAIRLILMGKRALGSVVSTQDYAGYLVEQINNRTFANQKSPRASICLEFTHTHKGKHNTFVVKRSWNDQGKESLRLKLNDEVMEGLTGEQVQAVLSEMIPPGVSDLFFFDGEKIAELAEDDTGTYLKEAVQKLLGIDVVNRLRDDLDIYLKQVTKDTIDKKSLELISQLEKEKSEIYQEASQARQRAEEIVPKLTELRRNAQHLESKLQERGGAWAKTKSSEKLRAQELINEEQRINGSILNELDGSFPLSLAPKAMNELHTHLEEEKQAKSLQAYSSKLKEQVPKISEKIATHLKTERSEIICALQDFIDNELEPVDQHRVQLDLSDSDYHRLQTQYEDALEAKANLHEKLESLSGVRSELSTLSLNIERAPDEGELHTLYQKLREVDKAIVTAKEEYRASLMEAKHKMAKAVEIAKRLEKLFNQQKNQATVMKAVTRVDSAQSALVQFSDRLTNLRVSQLEELFVASYRRLARKGELKLAAKINPKTFDVSLVDQSGAEINRKSLSAGEKQIFAFAILEALGKLSGKLLPVVVDTPLGRLDSKHRDKLITHYFPDAAEQVILLSTDTEVDESFYSLLSDNVSHAYEIAFDESSRSSKVSEGYFWNEREMEAV